MLPDNFRFAVENRTGGTIDANQITIKYRGEYYVNGKLTYEAESSDVLVQSSTITSTSVATGSTVDNGAKTNPCISAHVTIFMGLADNTATPNGNVIVYLQRATADTPVFTTNSELKDLDIIAVVPFTSKVDKSVTVPIR